MTFLSGLHKSCLYLPFTDLSQPSLQLQADLLTPNPIFNPPRGCYCNPIYNVRFATCRADRPGRSIASKSVSSSSLASSSSSSWSAASWSAASWSAVSWSTASSSSSTAATASTWMSHENLRVAAPPLSCPFVRAKIRNRIGCYSQVPYGIS